MKKDLEIKVFFLSWSKCNKWSISLVKGHNDNDLKSNIRDFTIPKVERCRYFESIFQRDRKIDLDITDRIHDLNE